MPSGSTMGEFLNAVRTRKTHIAEVLDGLFGTQKALKDLQTFEHLDDLRQSGVFDLDIPEWALAKLAGLTPKEIAHIRNWPPPLKEKLRVKVVESIDDLLSLDFEWRLHHGPNEETETPPPGQSGTVTFRSPESRVRIEGNQVEVAVGWSK